MTVKLGMFTMPFHHPDRDYAAILEEDQEAIVLADRLGFTEAFVGEHFSSWSERITSPLIFFATLINAGGFLAFAMADLPPVRQFGILSCLAFVLSMVADFTALPAALWMVFRQKPDDE